MTGAAWRDGPLIPPDCPPAATILLSHFGTPVEEPRNEPWLTSP
jgi:hypothetical protein